MAVHEEGLLAQMCEAAVDEGGYLLAGTGGRCMNSTTLGRNGCGKPKPS